jgi:DNA polymerase
VSGAKDRLRQYLEQRRELGESEFVLDSMSVEDALRVLGGRSGGDVSVAGPGAASESQRPPDSEKRRAAAAAAESGDWREALRQVGAESAPRTQKRAGVRPPAETPPAETPQGREKAAKPAPPPAGEPRVVGEGAARSLLTHLTTMDDVRGAVASCTACDLAASAKNPVPGEGDPTAKFVIVGEAPGATEDEQGKPFVGRSGDLLTKILEAIGLGRDDVFICNVLKHRPPGNRNPSTSEIHACRPFLLRQLELLQPRVILALGTFAAQTLLETDSPIGKLRGIEHRYHGIPLVATYHPAALLRNPNWKRPAWEDVQLARRILDRA